MARHSRFARLHRFIALATTFALLLGAAHPLEAATKKKKKKAAAPYERRGARCACRPRQRAPPPHPHPEPAATPPPPPPPPPASDAPTEPPGTAPAAGPPLHSKSWIPLGAKHTLVLDDLSGFRASTAGGLAYVGPLGFSVQSFSENIPAPNGSNAGTDTIHQTTFWFAPAADYFLFDHISIGILIEVAYTSSNFDQAVFQTTTKNQSLPSTLDVTVLPRAGYLLSFGEHWGIWPRLGLGWGLVQYNAVTNAGTGIATSPSATSTFLLDVDVGLLYRMDARWFLRAGPEVTFGPGSGLLSFSVAGGFGYMWSI